jgi:hypothetical protein
MSSLASVNGGDAWKLYTEAQDWLKGQAQWEVGYLSLCVRGM